MENIIHDAFLSGSRTAKKNRQLPVEYVFYAGYPFRILDSDIPAYTSDKKYSHKYAAIR